MSRRPPHGLALAEHQRSKAEVLHALTTHKGQSGLPNLDLDRDGLSPLQKADTGSVGAPQERTDNERTKGSQILVAVNCKD